jgi:hypothetical protein
VHYIYLPAIAQVAMLRFAGLVASDHGIHHAAIWQ